MSRHRIRPARAAALAAALLAADPPADDLRRLDARELHNRGTRRLAEGDLAGAEERWFTLHEELENASVDAD